MNEKTEDPKIYWHVLSFDGVQSFVHSSEYPKGFQMTSPGCESLEESKKKWGMPEKPCIECGQHFETNYLEPYKSILLRDNICFGCNHWRDMTKHNGDPNQSIVNGHHYMVCPESNEDSEYKGHGGAKFTIRFNDGRVVVTTNLWHQGEIPKHFKERLKDNAEFVRGV